jgi:hypothetical protein
VSGTYHLSYTIVLASSIEHLMTTCNYKVNKDDTDGLT